MAIYSKLKHKRKNITHRVPFRPHTRQRASTFRPIPAGTMFHHFRRRGSAESRRTSRKTCPACPSRVLPPRNTPDTGSWPSRRIWPAESTPGPQPVLGHQWPKEVATWPEVDLQVRVLSTVIRKLICTAIYECFLKQSHQFFFG